MKALMTVLMVVVYFGAVLGGILYVFSVREEYKEKTQEALFDKGNAAASFISAKDIGRIVSESDQGADVTEELKDRTNRLVQISGKARIAYILALREGDLSMLCISDPIGVEECTAREGISEEVSDGFWQIRQTGASQILSHDSNGSQVCVVTLSPIIDPDSGETTAVLVIHFSKSAYYDEVDKHTFHAVIIAASVLVLMGCLYWFVIQNERLKTLSRASQERESLFRTIFDQTPIGIAMMNQFTVMSAVNQTFLRILGRTEEELRIISWADITHPSDLEEDMAQFRRLQNDEINDYTMEKRFIRPDGSVVWVLMIVIRFITQGKSNFSHLCILQDISARKATETAFHESERSKSVLLSHLPGMAYRCRNDKEWTMEFVSEGCRSLTGYETEDLLGNRNVSFADLVIPEFRDLLRKEWDRVLKLHEPFKSEYEIETRDGTRKWVMELGQGVFGEYGEVEALEGIIIDMTERKKQEEHIQYLSEHDFLTGLFNRRHFDNEKDRLDIKENMPLSFFICDINGVRLINDAFGQIHGDRVIVETSRYLKNFCGENDVLARTGGNEFCILMPNTSAESAHNILERMENSLKKLNKERKNSGFDISLAIGFGTKTSTEQSLPDIVKEATDYMYSRKLLSRSSSHSSILSAIVATMYERSQETEEHAIRLADISKKIASRLSLSQKEMDDLEVFAMLHDIGKVGIDDRILNKPGKLTEEEWVIMKRHPEIGYRIAMASPDLENVAGYILSHHERWDGKGYPRGLSGKEIPLLSRIIALADAYDAMTEDRVYRKAMSSDEAIKEITRNSGTQFDPQIVELFLQVSKEFL